MIRSLWLRVPYLSPASESVGKMRFGRIQAFRVQALACVFGQRQPKGWTLNACMPRQSLFADRLAGGIVGAGFDELRWPRPVRPGDELRVESEVLEVLRSRSRTAQG